jgi:hypothetical protein
MALGLSNNNAYLHYTTDRTIKAIQNNSPEFQELLLTVYPVLIPSLLRAHSPDAGPEPSTSLTGTHIHL